MRLVAMKAADPDSRTPNDSREQDGSPAARRQIRSVELFNGEREVLIEHAGEVYSLRHTSKGKLILTK